MKERVGFTDDGQGLKSTIEAYYLPLKLKKDRLPFASIVFRCGTIVRLDCTDHEPIESFVDDPELETFLRNDFPDHRFVDMTYDVWRNENQTDFHWSQQTPYAAECRKAYGCLMRSGYPLPGGEGGDRLTMPWDVTDQNTFVFATIFQHLGFCCATPFHVLSIPREMEAKYPPSDESTKDRNWAIANDRTFVHSVDHETAELRRLDYMFPKPYAYVDHEMNIFIL